MNGEVAKEAAEKGMSLGKIFIQAMGISGVGLAIVFLALISIALMILLFSKIFTSSETEVKKPVQQNVPVPQSAPIAQASNDDSELVAAIIAAVSEEAGSDAMITSITEVK